MFSGTSISYGSRAPQTAAKGKAPAPRKPGLPATPMDLQKPQNYKSKFKAITLEDAPTPSVSEPSELLTPMMKSGEQESKKDHDTNMEIQGPVVPKPAPQAASVLPPKPAPARPIAPPKPKAPSLFIPSKKPQKVSRETAPILHDVLNTLAV